jgi:hypothetical protein
MMSRQEFIEWVRTFRALTPSQKVLIYAPATPRQIVYNGVTTICIFHDGTKVISRPQNGEKFDRETGVAMCIAKYIYGSRSKFLRAVESGHEQKRGEDEQERIESVE